MSTDMSAVNVKTTDDEVADQVKARTDSSQAVKAKTDISHAVKARTDSSNFPTSNNTHHKGDESETTAENKARTSSILSQARTSFQSLTSVEESRPRKKGTPGDFRKMATDAIMDELGSRGTELAPRSLGVAGCDLIFQLHEDVLVKDFLNGTAKWAQPERWQNGMMKKDSYVIVMTKTNVKKANSSIEKLLKSHTQLGAEKCRNANMIMVCAANTSEEIDFMMAKSKSHPEVHFLAIDTAKLSTEGEFDWTKIRTVAGASAVGVAAGGVTGGTVGGVTGTALGAAVGVVPALFTFGLSIPVCAVVGGGVGACTGAVAGCAVGGVGGGGAGYLGYQHRGSIKPVVEKLGDQARELVVSGKEQWNKVVVEGGGREVVKGLATRKV